MLKGVRDFVMIVCALVSALSLVYLVYRVEDLRNDLSSRNGLAAVTAVAPNGKDFITMFGIARDDPAMTIIKPMRPSQ